MKYLTLTLALLLATTAPAAAQTARIAHFSHGGSLATLDAAAAADNFGIIRIPSHFVTDSVRFLSDTTSLEYGKWTGGYYDKENSSDKDRTVQFAGKRVDKLRMFSRAKYLESLRRLEQPVKVVGDTMLDASKATKHQLFKTKHRRKESALAPMPTVPGGPAVPGGLLLGAGVLLLAGAGWLLTAADKRPLASA